MYTKCFLLQRSQVFAQYLLKKLRKRCWHNLGCVVLYTSRRDTALNEPRSLDTLKFDLSKLNIEPIKKRMCGSSVLWTRDQVKLVSFNNKSRIGSSIKLYWRVWSWLRTNAGGMPNTCKSNGEFLTLRIFSVTPSGESEAFTTLFIVWQHIQAGNTERFSVLETLSGERVSNA